MNLLTVFAEVKFEQQAALATIQRATNDVRRLVGQPPLADIYPAGNVVALNEQIVLAAELLRAGVTHLRQAVEAQVNPLRPAPVQPVTTQPVEKPAVEQPAAQTMPQVATSEPTLPPRVEAANRMIEAFAQAERLGTTPAEEPPVSVEPVLAAADPVPQPEPTPDPESNGSHTGGRGGKGKPRKK